MSSTRPVLLERGLLKVVAQEKAGESGSVGRDAFSAYDVVIDGQEVLRTFSTYDEAEQFVDMLSPGLSVADDAIAVAEERRSTKKF
ncbi:MAG: hypothetical protein SVX28_01575 [Pseudomonadota bacterium]|nr:hypothetical protein [Pseudomonadota bacterium]